MDPLAEAKIKLNALPDGARVAVITYQGSFCPITRGHILCPVIAREILLGIREKPLRLEDFNEVIAFLKCNADSFVGSKLSKKKPPVPIIPYTDRMRLIDMVACEYDWMWTNDNPRGAMSDLIKLYPKLIFAHSGLCGADDAIKYKKWNTATPKHRVVCMGRPADPGADNGTEGVRKGMAADGVDAEAGLFILGPELPDISSSAVRKALADNDESQLQDLLHPSVMEWNLNEGPYVPKVEATPQAMPLGEFIFDRNKKASVTHVRNRPTDSRADDVFIWDMCVADGDTVCLREIDGSGSFGYIDFERGEGWVKLEYLHCTEGSTWAAHRRDDAANGTPLRTAPTNAHHWAKGAEGLVNGDIATLLRPDNRRHWNFFLVNFKGHEGWLKVEHLAFGLSGFRAEILHQARAAPHHGDDERGVRNVFRSMDTEGTGKIGKECLARALTTLCTEMTGNGNLDKLFEELDHNRDGVIDYEEFLRWVFN